MNKFKVGDILRCKKNVPYKDKVFIFSKHDINYPFLDILEKNCEIWIPKEGEFCWFSDNEEYMPVFGIFLKKVDNKFECKTPNGQGSLTIKSFKLIKPFLGELPTFVNGVK